MDLTLIDTSSLEIHRNQRNWSLVLNCIHHSLLFDGIRDMLEALKGNFMLGIVTSSPSIYAKKVLQYHDILKYFDTIVCYHDTIGHKPSPEPMFKCAEKMKVDCTNCISIGDNVIDVIAAKKAGMKTGIIKWYEGYSKDTDADYEFNAPRDVVTMLDKNSD